MVRASAINWPSEGVPSSTINSGPNRTVTYFFQNKFPKGHPIRAFERRNPLR